MNTEDTEEHITTLGRLARYEGDIIVKEALEYAKEKEMFVFCDSKYAGEMTNINTYKNKKGVIIKAHYSVYGRFIGYAKEGDEEPKSYTGYFLYKTYADKLNKYLRKNIDNGFTKLEDLFEFKTIEGEDE